MNSFNKTEAAVFSCRLCFLRAFPFISLYKFYHHHDCSYSTQYNMWTETLDGSIVCYTNTTNMVVLLLTVHQLFVGMKHLYHLAAGRVPRGRNTSVGPQPVQGKHQGTARHDHNGPRHSGPLHRQHTRQQVGIGRSISRALCWTIVTCYIKLGTLTIALH